MRKVTVDASIKYDVWIGSGLLERAGAYVSEVFPRCKLCVVSDDTVYGLYGETVIASLQDAGYDVCVFTFAAGERSKNLDTVSALLEFLAKEQLTRTDAIVALGGGVTGDFAGFAAACYLRGIPFAQIPTTLLAAVDSSVGGKTGVNLTSGKNLAGAFWQPSLVLCDYSLFESLEADILLDGIAEVIKYGVIADEELFKVMASNDVASLFENNLLEQVIEKCVTIKSNIVSEDERDTGKRQLLNFGHTLGHAIERCSNYEISHGHAVAIGMLYMSRAAAQAGLSPESCATDIEAVLKKYHFARSCNYSADQLYEAALIDKKRTGNSITLILPDRIGCCRLEKVELSLFRELVENGVRYEC
ncbi:MAG: 3-dehydroquinate synthase [Clostridiales bacterium]|nr:3-dehydroquinate synthase [Clostridiales bacterium]